VRDGIWYYFEENGNLKDQEVYKDGISDKPDLKKFEKLDKEESEILRQNNE